MKIEPILINIVLFVVVAVLVGGFVIDVNSFYGVNDNTTTTEDWLQFNSTYTELEDSMEDVQNRTVGFATKELTDPSKYTDALMAFIDVGVVILRIPTTLGHYVDYITGIMGFYVPNIIKAAVGLIIAIIFTLRVASIFIKPGDDI